MYSVHCISSFIFVYSRWITDLLNNFCIKIIVSPRSAVKSIVLPRSSPCITEIKFKSSACCAYATNSSDTDCTMHANWLKSHVLHQMWQVACWLMLVTEWQCSIIYSSVVHKLAVSSVRLVIENKMVATLSWPNFNGMNGTIIHWIKSKALTCWCLGGVAGD